MARLPIILGIARTPGNAFKFAGGTAAPAIDPVLKKQILDRDDHTCAGCGFKSQKYQEVHFLNHDSQDLNPNNLITTCSFCHQCFNLDKVAQMRSGVLVWLPEIPQTELNHLARALFVARISQGPLSDTARKILDMLMARRELARQRLGSDDPYVLATVLRDYIGPRHYAEREQKLQGIRLLPIDRRIIREADLEFNQFPQILAYWRSKDGPFSGKVPGLWVEMYKDLFRQAG